MARMPIWPSVEVDLTELDVEVAFERISQVPDSSTLPTPKLPEPLPVRDSDRVTERPSPEEIKALKYQAKTGVGWFEQPQISYDSELCCVTLVAPLTVIVADRFNNHFHVHCEKGLTVAVHEGVAALPFFKNLKAEFVKAQVKKSPFADIVPFTREGTHQIYIDSQWLEVILSSLKDASEANL